MSNKNVYLKIIHRVNQLGHLNIRNQYQNTYWKNNFHVVYSQIPVDYNYDISYIVSL